MQNYSVFVVIFTGDILFKTTVKLYVVTNTDVKNAHTDYQSGVNYTNIGVVVVVPALL